MGAAESPAEVTTHVLRTCGLLRADLLACLHCNAEIQAAEGLSLRIPLTKQCRVKGCLRARGCSCNLVQRNVTHPHPVSWLGRAAEA